MKKQLVCEVIFHGDEITQDAIEQRIKNVMRRHDLDESGACEFLILLGLYKDEEQTRELCGAPSRSEHALTNFYHEWMVSWLYDLGGDNV